MSRYLLFRGTDRPLETVVEDVRPPRAGEVLVRVEGCTICRSDLHTYSGRRSEPLPLVLGHEIVGRIEAFGPGTARADGSGIEASIGDRVVWAIAVGCGECGRCRAELPQKCERLFKYGHRRHVPGEPPAGGLSDHVMLVPGTVWFRVPETVSLAAAMPAACVGATAAAMLCASGPIAGRSVLVLGAGMLGLAACAMARAAGASQMTVSDPDPEARERAVSFGADRVAAGGADLDGLTADLVFEAAGPAGSVAAALERADIGGTIVLAGSVSPGGAVSLDPEQVVRRLLTLRGVHNYHPRDLAYTLEFLAGAGRSYPFSELLSAVYPLEEAEAAMRHAIQAKGRVGVFSYEASRECGGAA